MASSSRLSGTVMEDAVPLDQQGEALQTPLSGPFRRPQLAPERGLASTSRHQSSRGDRGLPSTQQQPRIMESGFPGSETSQETRTERSRQRSTGGGVRDSHGSSQPPVQSSCPGGRSAGRGEGRVSQPDEDATVDILKGVGKAVMTAVSEREFLSVQNPSLASSELSSLEKGVARLNLVPEPVAEWEIKKYRGRMPDTLKIDYYDAMILYQDSDLQAVRKFLKRVNADVRLNKVEEPAVVLYDQILPHAGIPKVGELDITLEYCTYVFLYVTKTFCEEKWTEFAAQTALMNAIENPDSRWSVVPIFTEPKRNPTFKIPPSIRSLKGIQYWSDDKFYVDSLRKLLEDKLHVRLEKGQELKLKREHWVREYKVSTRQEEERKQLEEQHRQQLVADRERKHQEELELKNHRFQEQRKKEQQRQQQIRIHSLEEGINYYGHQNPTPQNHLVDNYVQNLYRHMRMPANSAATCGPGLMGEHGNQQGLAELPYLHHSQSLPDHLAPPAFLPQHQPAGIAPVPPPGCNLAGYPGQWGAPPPGYQHAEWSLPPDTFPSNAHHFGTLSHGQSLPSFPPSSVEKPSVSGKDLPSAAGQAGEGSPPVKGGQNTHLSAYQPLPDTGPHRAQQTATSPDSKNTGQPALASGEKDQAGLPVTGNISGGPDGSADPSSSTQEREEDAEVLGKDLEEDVPADSLHYRPGPPAALPPQATKPGGPPCFSETIQQSSMHCHGPAHHGGSRARAEPVERGPPPYDSPVMYGGQAGTADRYPGQQPPPLQYAAPPHRQFHPHYTGPYANPYYLPHFAPEFSPQQYPFPGQVPHLAYAMHPQYGIPGYHPQAGFANLPYPVQHSEDMQYRLPPAENMQQYRLPPAENLQQYRAPPTENLQQYRAPPAENMQQYRLPPAENMQQYRAPPTENVQQYQAPPSENLQQYPVQRIENLQQYPAQYQTSSWPPSALPIPRTASAPTPTPASTNRPQAPNTQHGENPSPAVIHHYHFHHGRGGEEAAAATTINYISKAENVMVADRISTGKSSRRRERGGAQSPEGGGEEEEAESSPESLYNNPESQSYGVTQPASSGDVRDQQSRDLTLEESVTLTPSGAHNSQNQPVVLTYREQMNSPQLTGNVSGDDRSRRSSDQSTAPVTGPVGLPEVAADPYMYTSRTPYSSSASSSSSTLAQLRPLQGSQPRSVTAGCGAVPEDHVLHDWPQRFEQERETELKQLVTGPSVEEESFLREDRERGEEETCLKGSKQ